MPFVSYTRQIAVPGLSAGHVAPAMTPAACRRASSASSRPSHSASTASVLVPSSSAGGEVLGPARGTSIGRRGPRKPLGSAADGMAQRLEQPAVRELLVVSRRDRVAHRPTREPRSPAAAARPPPPASVPDHSANAASISARVLRALTDRRERLGPLRPAHQHDELLPLLGRRERDRDPAVARRVHVDRRAARDPRSRCAPASRSPRSGRRARPTPARSARRASTGRRAARARSGRVGATRPSTPIAANAALVKSATAAPVRTGGPSAKPVLAISPDAACTAWSIAGASARGPVCP